jgi:hypothetical protein
MDVAAGCARNGDLIVISSGHSPALPPGTDMQGFDFEASWNLDNLVCRSSDGGHTWTREESVTAPVNHLECWCIPFGDIAAGPDGILAAGFYTGRRGKGETHNSAWMLRSVDDGLTWGDGTLIAADGYNETDLLHLGGGRWLAACRTVLTSADPLVGAHTQLFVSRDNGRSWTDSGVL